MPTLTTGEGVGLDPTAQLLLTIFGAALVTALAGFAGATFQGHREHRRWLLDRRFEAFVRAFTVIKAFDLNWSKQRKLVESGTPVGHPDLQALMSHADELYTTVADALAPIIVLGPDSVAKQVQRMQKAYEDDDRASQGAAERAFVASAREALKIRR
jgi:hypothetical protein